MMFRSEKHFLSNMLWKTFGAHGPMVVYVFFLLWYQGQQAQQPQDPKWKHGHTGIWPGPRGPGWAHGLRAELSETALDLEQVCTPTFLQGVDPMGWAWPPHCPRCAFGT